jgi:hypothetical protein
MKRELKESVSRILLIVFGLIFLISLTFMSMPGNWVVLWGCFGFMPTLSLIFGIDKHRKYAIIELVILLVFIMGDHIAGQKLNERRLSSCHREMTELKGKLEKYEGQNINMLMPDSPDDLN